jgi:hypothetical protein
MLACDLEIKYLTRILIKQEYLATVSYKRIWFCYHYVQTGTKEL